MKSFFGTTCICACLSFEAWAWKPTAFQVQPKSYWGLRRGSADDYMQDMAGEMAKLSANYDHSFNKSPSAQTYIETPGLLQAMEQAQLDLQAMQEQAREEAALIVSPWSKDDIMRDMAAEWDALGTNYDYSYNNSPTDARSHETESQREIMKGRLQASQAMAQQEADPFVKSWERDDWEQWMQLSKTADSGKNDLLEQSYAEEYTMQPQVAPKSAFGAQSYLDSL